MRWENAGVTNLNHIMDTVTKYFLTFEKIKPVIKSNNFTRYYTIISNIEDCYNTFIRIRKYIDQSAISIPSISSHFKNV
jgi:hypothetical protein